MSLSVSRATALRNAARSVLAPDAVSEKTLTQPAARDRYPLIVQAALKLRKTSFVIDGEAVVLRPDGISDFAALYSGKRNAEVRLYAFDLLADTGVDMREETLLIRKLWLGKLLKRATDGIMLNEHEAGEIGPALFQQACKMGLEGIVSKRSDRPCKAGHSPVG